ncbi:MAG: glycine--tRNA ligase [Firmicutes bacterium]|nr:glycine--tRNA ligase [Bacillota bacterium]
MDKIVALCKGRGFVFAGSEIYGGLANTWDYGPLGVELKNNIKKLWWASFVKQHALVVGLDSGILLNPKVWEASGHVGGFSDPLIDCKGCKTRHRADHLVEAFIQRKSKGKPNAEYGGVALAAVATMEDALLSKYIADNAIPCPCGKSEFTPIRKFNLMFKTFQGVTEESADTIYMRPETAQGIFVNFKNIQRTTRMKIPFGVGQIGKAFRNEITPGNFIFRTREFEQMELEFFCREGTDAEWFTYWEKFCNEWLLSLGVRAENLRIREHSADELSHYSKRTIDFEYKFPFGWGEISGIANRTDYDLKAHEKASGISQEYICPQTNERFIPYVIEPTFGVARLFLMYLIDAYTEEDLGKGDTRTVLKLHNALAPYKVAVLPLSKKLSESAREIYADLSKHFSATYDESGAIGKLYRRQDEIGTPFCVTVDFDTLDDGKVTVRERDSMKQKRVAIKSLKKYIEDRVGL